MKIEIRITDEVNGDLKTQIDDVDEKNIGLCLYNMAASILSLRNMRENNRARTLADLFDEE